MPTKRKKKYTANARQPANVDRKLLNIDEAALYLGVTERWMKDAIAQRRFPIIKVGKLLRFHTDDLDAYIESRRVPAGR
jgi:excisionase family DNA binding protein